MQTKQIQDAGHFEAKQKSKKRWQRKIGGGGVTVKQVSLGKMQSLEKEYEEILERTRGKEKMQ